MVKIFDKIFRRKKEEEAKPEPKEEIVVPPATPAETEKDQITEGIRIEVPLSTKPEEIEKQQTEEIKPVAKEEITPSQITSTIIGGRQEEKKEGIEDLAYEVGKQYLERALFTYQKILEEIKNLDEYLKQAEQSLKAIEGIEKQYKENARILRERLEEYKAAVEESRKKLEEYRAKINDKLEAFDDIVKRLLNEGVRPHREIEEEMQRYIKEAESVQREYEELGKKMHQMLERARKIQENPVVLSILQRYAKRSNNVDEEGLAIIELLNEPLETLKYAVSLGKQLGYTNYELMPIMAAAGLKTYRYGKGVSEELLREFGVSKRDLEGYIVDVGVKTNNPQVRERILKEMMKSA